VGKSTLINGITCTEVAKTSDQLDSCTHTVEYYTVEIHYRNENGQQKTSHIKYIDSPGIEYWAEGSLKKFVSGIVLQYTPICAFICASPGSFLDTKTTGSMVNILLEQKILVACVCTNMWQGDYRNVLESFKLIFPGLSFTNPKNSRYKEMLVSNNNDVLLFAVNSVPYQLNTPYGCVSAPVQGIYELMYEVLCRLSEEKLEGWCLAILSNRSYWLKFQHCLNGAAEEWLKPTLDKLTRFLDMGNLGGSNFLPWR